MKISIDKKTLSNALDIVSKAIATKTTMQILEGVLLEAKDKTFTLTGNNLEISIKHTVECDVNEPGKIVAEFRLFQDIVRKLPDEKINITADDKIMIIEAGQVKMEINIIPADNYPAIQEINGSTSLKIPADEFRNMINGVSFAASLDESKPVLTAVLIEQKDGTLNTVACDSFMLALRKVECNDGELSLLIRAKDIGKLYKVFDESVQIRTGKNRNVVLIEDKSTKSFVRIIEGTYVNYKSFFNVDARTTVRIKTSDLKATIERALLFADFSNGKPRLFPIDVHITCDKLAIFIQSMRGRFDETILAETTGEDLNIRLNPKQLNEVLRHIEDDEIFLKFSGSLNPCIISPVEGDKFLYVMSAVK